MTLYALYGLKHKSAVIRRIRIIRVPYHPRSIGSRPRTHTGPPALPGF